MKRPVIFMATISVLLTAALCLHDYRYDPPSVPYTLAHHIVEILTVGPLFAAIIFALLYLPYAIVSSVVRKYKARKG